MRMVKWFENRTACGQWKSKAPKLFISFFSIAYSICVEYVTAKAQAMHCTTEHRFFFSVLSASFFCCCCFHWNIFLYLILLSPREMVVNVYKSLCEIDTLSLVLPFSICMPCIWSAVWVWIKQIHHDSYGGDATNCFASCEYFSAFPHHNLYECNMEKNCTRNF